MTSTRARSSLVCVLAWLSGCAPAAPVDHVVSAVHVASTPELTLGGSPSRVEPVPLDGQFQFKRGASGYLALFYSIVPSGRARVLVARTGADTTLLDQPAIGLPTDYLTNGALGIVGELGGRWLVLYPDLSASGPVARFASFAETGATPAITRTSAPRLLDTGVAGCDAAGCLFVGHDGAQRVDATGALAGPMFVYGPTTGGLLRTVSVATTRDQWLVVWNAPHPTTNQPDLRAARIARDGTLRDGAGVVFSTVGAGRETPSVATDGTRFLVAYRVSMGSGARGPGIYAQLLDVSAGISAGAPIALASGTDVTFPSVAWDGARYWVTWQRADHNAQYVRLDAMGAALDATAREASAAPSPSGPLDTARYPIAESAPGGGAAIAWLSGGRIAVQTFRADGAATGAPHFLSYLADVWRTPTIASDGRSFLVGCAQRDAPGLEPQLARFFLVRPDGSLSDGGSYAGEAPTSLVWDGTSYRGFNALETTVVSSTGTPVAPTPVALPSGRALTGVNAVLGGVTFATLTGTPPALVRLDASGRMLDPFPIAVGGASARALATDGTVVMAWWANGSARISAAGDVLDATPWDWSYVPPGTSTPLRLGDAHLAYGAGLWTVAAGGDSGVWVLQKSGPASPVRATRIASATGVFGAVWNGREFVVLGSTGSTSTLQRPLAVWSVSPDGVVTPPEGVSLGADWLGFASTTEPNPQLAVTRDGIAAALYARFDPLQNTFRCSVRLLAPDGDAGVVDAGVDASSADVFVDAGPLDAPVVDAIVADVPIADAIVADVTPDTVAREAEVDVLMDLGHDVDDAVTIDARVEDVAAPLDAAVNDAMAPDVALVDAFSDGASTPGPSGDGNCSARCGVGASRARPPRVHGLLLVAALFVRRRRRSVCPARSA